MFLVFIYTCTIVDLDGHDQVLGGVFLPLPQKLMLVRTNRTAYIYIMAAYITYIMAAYITYIMATYITYIMAAYITHIMAAFTGKL